MNEAPRILIGGIYAPHNQDTTLKEIIQKLEKKFDVDSFFGIYTYRNLNPLDQKYNGLILETQVLLNVIKNDFQKLLDAQKPQVAIIRYHPSENPERLKKEYGENLVYIPYQTSPDKIMEELEKLLKINAN